MAAGATGEHETLQHAAQQMRDLGVGSLPIRGDDDRLPRAIAPQTSWAADHIGFGLLSKGNLRVRLGT